MDMTLTEADIMNPDALAEHVTLHVRSRLEASPLSLVWARFPGRLCVDYYTPRGRLYAVCFSLPPAYHWRTERAITVLLARLQAGAGALTDDLSDDGRRFR